MLALGSVSHKAIALTTRPSSPSTSIATSRKHIQSRARFQTLYLFLCKPHFPSLSLSLSHYLPLSCQLYLSIYLFLPNLSLYFFLPFLSPSLSFSHLSLSFPLSLSFSLFASFLPNLSIKKILTHSIYIFLTHYLYLSLSLPLSYPISLFLTKSPFLYLSLTFTNILRMFRTLFQHPDALKLRRALVLSLSSSSYLSCSYLSLSRLFLYLLLIFL